MLGTTHTVKLSKSQSMCLRPRAKKTRGGLEDTRLTNNRHGAECSGCRTRTRVKRCEILEKEEKALD